MSATTYVVLQVTEGSNGQIFEHVDEIQAASSDGAIRLAAKVEGTYVAVPARSWKEIPVRFFQPPPRMITAVPKHEDHPPTEEYAPAEVEPEMTPA